MEQHESIEKYVQGHLTQEEKMTFEKELATNVQLAEALADFRKNQLAINAAARQQLRQQAGEVYQSQLTPRNKRVLLMRKIAVAAGVLGLVTVGLWHFNNNEKSSPPDQLFAQYFEMPTAPAVRSGDISSNEKWAQAIKFYSSNNFNKAIPIFKELISDENFSEKETAKLLLGTSLLAINKPDDAFIIFNKINPESSFKEDAEWYAALALLKAGKMDAAKKALENIVQQKNHFKKGEADRILGDW